MPTNYEELADTWQAELLANRGVTSLFQVPEDVFYKFLAERAKIWHPSHNKLVGRWSESINARKRSNSGIL